VRPVRVEVLSSGLSAAKPPYVSLLLSLADPSDLALNPNRKLVAAEPAHPPLVVIVAAALLHQS